MATERVVTAAVRLAVDTATIDADAPDDERCRFDPAALAGVMRLCDSGQGRDAVVEVTQRELQQRVEELDPDRTLAAVALLARIAAGTQRRPVVVEDIEGNVGTGRGSTPPG